MSQLNSKDIPLKTKENIKKTAKMEYYRIAFNSEGERIRSSAKTMSILIELFIDDLIEIDERYKSE